MQTPAGHELVEQMGMCLITDPYDVIPNINEDSPGELKILDIWVRHMKSKSAPYAVTQAQGNLKLYVQRTVK